MCVRLFRPAEEASHAGGEYVVVSNSGSDDVSIIDTKARHELARVKTGKIPKRVVIAALPAGGSPK